MSINVVQIIIWAVTLTVGEGGYGVGHAGLEKAMLVYFISDNDFPVGGMQYAPHNNSPSKGF